MSIFRFIEWSNIGTGVISNSLLIYLSLRFSKPSMATYKYLLVIFASYDLLLTAIHVIIDPKIYNFDTVFSLCSLRFPDVSWLGPVYCSCFTLPFAITNINFLHRYWAVKNPLRLQLFSSWRLTCALAMYPIGQGIGWVFLSLQNVTDDSRMVENRYFAEFNVTITGWRVMHHWKDGQHNLRPFLVLFIAVILMSINFSIAIFLASQTMAGIRKAKSFSPNFKTMHMKIMQALLAQTAVPVLFVYVPFGCAITFPFLNIEEHFHVGVHCMTITSFFPAWDAIVVILLIKDYRDGLLSLLYHRNNATSSTQTTAWSTAQISTPGGLQG